MDMWPVQFLNLLLAEDVGAREVLEMRLAGLYIASLNVRGGAEGDDEVGLLGRHGLDIIGVIVCIVAREGLAAREARLLSLAFVAGRVHHLHAVNVTRVHDSGDVIVCGAAGALEGDLGEHAGVVCATFRDRVGVTDP